jgi:hypothetical protein
LQFKAGEKVKKFSYIVRTVEIKNVEINDKMESEIANLRAQISADSITSTRAAAVTEVGQVDKARIAD